MGCASCPGNGCTQQAHTSSYTLLFRISDKISRGNKVFKDLCFPLCASWRFELFPLSAQIYNERCNWEPNHLKWGAQSKTKACTKACVSHLLSQLWNSGSQFNSVSAKKTTTNQTMEDMVRKSIWPILQWVCTKVNIVDFNFLLTTEPWKGIFILYPSMKLVGFKWK